MKKINIAIDGPAGAGKSTVAKRVASGLQYVYVDTGAMYRALTWRALQSRVDIKDGLSLSSLLRKTNIELDSDTKLNRVCVDGVEITEEIRSQEVTASVSIVSAHAGVRTQMVEKQQELAERKGTVLDGRDIGTTVLPDAELKVFLYASVEERARRRHNENIEKGRPSDLQMIMEDIQSRDATDANREVSPLMKAEDAVEIDSTEISVGEVVNRICTLAEERAAAL